MYHSVVYKCTTQAQSPLLCNAHVNRGVQWRHIYLRTVVAVVICLRTGAKVSVAHMYGFQHQPVPVVSLASGWAIENAYIGRDKQYSTYDPNNPTWPCAAS
jgi:hypothetical protein